GHGLERVGRDEFAIPMQLMRELGGYFITMLALGLVHGVLAHIDQQHILHGNLSLNENEPKPWLVYEKPYSLATIAALAALIPSCSKQRASARRTSADTTSTV